MFCMKDLGKSLRGPGTMLCMKDLGKSLHRPGTMLCMKDLGKSLHGPGTMQREFWWSCPIRDVNCLCCDTFHESM
ncbi:hypothetical protein MANES_11G106501v8 [Manihot esculenta]|uniref:Uncharacterized protein n=1 Tax=Manihot esculenta TaxID=3983 RepID=A0ACB7GV49_MANES|nr:hypothetical protein MANES_11G106501v8 [Manihot esculenta]